MKKPGSQPQSVPVGSLVKTRHESVGVPKGTLGLVVATEVPFDWCMVKFFKDALIPNSYYQPPDLEIVSDSA